MKTYKGFDKNMKCRDFQYEIGKTYIHEGDTKACHSGFHACEYPLDVFGYYPPADSVYCETEQDGKISKHDDDSKVASSEIKVIGSIDIAGMIKAAIDFTLSRCDKTKEQHATGYQSASSATGDLSASSATGDRSASSATGDQSASSATGNYSSVCIVDTDAIKSKESIAAGFGYKNKAKASAGSWIILANRNNNGEILHIKSAKAGVEIEADTWYTITDSGEFVKI
jgi:hypothetical protein